MYNYILEDIEGFFKKILSQMYSKYSLNVVNKFQDFKRNDI